MKHKIIVLLGAFVISFCAKAENAVLNSFELWSTLDGEDVVRVIPKGTGVVNVGCSDPDSYLVSRSLTEPAKQRIYSALLAAKMASTSVKLFIAACESNRPAVRNVILE